jgi:DNA-binding NarL/FixJ family response regulator
MLKIKIVEDNIHLRKALRVGLEASRKAQVMGEVSRGENALMASHQEQPDVVLMDIALEGNLKGDSNSSFPAAGIPAFTNRVLLHSG